MAPTPDVMEDVLQKLVALNYPRAYVPAQSLLYAGLERYTLLEWLFFKLLGDKSPFAEQDRVGVVAAQDEELVKIQYLAGIAKFLGLTSGLDTEAIQGKGSYESRADSLQSLVELVEASLFADNSEWSGDYQLAKDVQLLDAIAERQNYVLSEECRLFPADVPVDSQSAVPQLQDLEARLAEHLEQAARLQELILAGKQSYDPNEDHREAEAELRSQLQTFLETARVFDNIYGKEIRPWTHMMEVPQLHGLGPAANHVLESYKQLLKLLRSLKSHREAYSSVVEADDTGDERLSLGKLVADCEEALTFLNYGLSVLGDAHSRTREGLVGTQERVEEKVQEWGYATP